MGGASFLAFMVESPKQKLTLLGKTSCPIKLQEAMESSAFPGKIKINLMQFKIWKLLNISNATKNCTKAQEAVCLFTGNIRKIPFFILIATQREMHQSEKGQCKNLPEAIQYKDTPKSALKNISCGYAGRTNT